ncbi:MAG: UDP-galactopyranose mutase [Christensenellaceae bacterium]|jgi:UDP-galactopyranose mutase|nr:UDP-galactopyranose mutase [Christensenellaceae bacterium]
MGWKYDYLIVGAGFYGAVCAYELTKLNKKCLVIDKRDHIGGTSYSTDEEGINVHKYGAHIFRTNSKVVWDYVNRVVEFNRFTNSPVAMYKKKLYNLPFNMNTFYQIWGVITPDEAAKKIKEQIDQEKIVDPKNLEEKALSLVGRDIYNILIKGYTEKQWGRPPRELPEFIINRVPLRFVFDNNYFNDNYQGIPIGGYSKIFEYWLDGIDVKLRTEYFKNKKELSKIAEKIIFTGQIDRFYEFRCGALEYRSLRFETEKIEISNFQGSAVVNYTDIEVPYTRIIEHKHFQFAKPYRDHTIITKEFPAIYDSSNEPFYPINDAKNNEIFKKYLELSKKEKSIYFGGRLGDYAYYDMDKVIERALSFVGSLNG